MLLSIILAAATASPSSSAWTAEKPAVRAAALRAFPKANIESILIKQHYALVAGKGIHAVFHKSRARWSAVCDLQRTTMTQQRLQTQCGVPGSTAAQLASDEPINMLVAAGNFSTAISAQQQLAGSAPPTLSVSEAARLQELRTLNQQMQTQQITRAQAIQQWNQFQYSWALP